MDVAALRDGGSPRLIRRTARCSYAARRPANTANSNALMSSGHLTTSVSLESANQPGEHRGGDDGGSRQPETQPKADRTIVRRASCEPRSEERRVGEEG